uniref:Thioredoxin domain-containing protein 17 n=1 Tax=Sus scrofa TaxID=9823 RepID=A0A8D0UNZ0_PIG
MEGAHEGGDPNWLDVITVQGLEPQNEGACRTGARTSLTFMWRPATPSEPASSCAGLGAQAAVDTPAVTGTPAIFFLPGRWAKPPEPVSTPRGPGTLGATAGTSAAAGTLALCLRPQDVGIHSEPVSSPTSPGDRSQLRRAAQDTSRGPRPAFPMARYEEVSVSGYEEFIQAVKQHNGKTIFAYFSGSKDAEGKSWCPDCVQAEPVVREGLKHTVEGCVFIYCQVGERLYWKDPNNDFRKKLKLTAVPTLLKYGTPQKLVESECLQTNLVEMLFSEE